jgi:propionyl-CoA carboxylase alpha chain
LLVKAAAGGGGRGMRRVAEASELSAAIASAEREASSAFGDPTLFLERCWDGARHVEVQVLGDQHGNLVHLFERDCSVQRRHQKLIEEAPAPGLSDELRGRLYAAALRLARAIDYTSAGTVEFLVKDDDVALLEMNTRLQVEHPATEALVGVDLVRLQIQIAEGKALPFEQGALVPRGHAVEARLYAEDPAQDFRPSVGRLARFALLNVPGIRYDTAVETGSYVGSDYDGLLAKAIAHAPTRDEAVARLALALRGLHVHGVRTNRDMLVATLENEAFCRGGVGTDFLAQHPEVLAPVLDAATLRRHAAAAALVLRERQQQARAVLRFVPAGWRNMPSAAMRTRLRTGDGELDVALDDEDMHVHALAADAVDLEVSGLRARYAVHVVEDRCYVNSEAVQVDFEIEPRFGRIEAASALGGPTSPLPGTVVAVHVEPGQRVAAGQTLVVLHAMKIEHAIASDRDGVVAEVRVAAGEHVDAHQVLVVLQP